MHTVNLVSELPYLLPPDEEEVTPECFKHFKPTEVEEYPEGLPFSEPVDEFFDIS